MPLEKAVYQATVRTTIQAVACVAVLMGVDMAASGPGRFTSPGLATARTAPGGVYTWAALVAIGGLLTLAGMARGWQRHLVMAGLAWTGTWFLFFDISLWVTRLTDPNTAVTGCWTYLLLAFVCAVLFAGGHGLATIHRPEGHRREETPPP